MKPLALSAVCLLACVSARAQLFDKLKKGAADIPSAPGAPEAPAQPMSAPEKDPNAPHDGRKFMGDWKKLLPVDGLAESEMVRLLMDDGAGSEKSPRYYYLLHLPAKDDSHPLALFRIPAGDGYPEFPGVDKVFIGREPSMGKAHPDQPFQIWKFGDNPAKRLYGETNMVRDGGRKGDVPAEVRPMIWWGLAVGQELDQKDPKELAKLLEDKTNNPLGF